MISIYNICYLFLMFWFYSFLGWILEVTNSYRVHKRFINRGFMIGPYCPIYGFGVLAIIALLKKYTDNVLVLFILSMVICMILEYLISYIMEVLFKARWWDYSNYKFNINGRVCLETAVPFGLGGMFVMYVLNNILCGVLDKFSHNLIIVLGIGLGVIFITDITISLIVMVKFRNKVKSYKDETEEMSRRVREYLFNHSVLTKRLVNSYPNFKFRMNKLKEKYEEKREKSLK